MLNKIEHVGLAVADLDAAIQMYSQVWGMHLEHREVVEDQGVEEALFGIGDSHIQLVGSLGPDTVIGRFLSVRGEGLHHIAYEVKDLQATLDSLREKGVQLVDEKPRQGGQGKLIAFVHPKANHGLLIELIQED